MATGSCSQRDKKCNSLRDKVRSAWNINYVAMTVDVMDVKRNFSRHKCIAVASTITSAWNPLTTYFMSRLKCDYCRCNVLKLLRAHGVCFVFRNTIVQPVIISELKCFHFICDV